MKVSSALTAGLRIWARELQWIVGLIELDRFQFVGNLPLPVLGKTCPSPIDAARTLRIVCELDFYVP